MARVLIVDDTDIVRRALELAVRQMGHLAVSTSDALEALALARRSPPDLALLDFRMPGMDGVTLYEEMRASLGERCPRVLFVSASSAEEVQRAIGARFRPAGYVKKPFHLDDLCRVVASALGGAEVAPATQPQPAARPA